MIMSYKVVRNTAGDLVCFGPNESFYEPTIAPGQVLTIEANVPASSLSATKAAQIIKINQSADNAFNQIKAGYPKSEIDTWDSQFNEATALALSATAKTTTIDGIVLTSGASKAAVQAKILEKAALYQAKAGEIIGKRQKLTAQINALATDTNAKVELIVW